MGSFPGLLTPQETPVSINQNALRTRTVPKIESTPTARPDGNKSQSVDKDLFKNSGGPGNEDDSDSEDEDEAAFKNIDQSNIDMYRAGSLDPANESQDTLAIGKREREDDVDG